MKTNTDKVIYINFFILQAPFSNIQSYFEFVNVTNKNKREMSDRQLA